MEQGTSDKTYTVVVADDRPMLRRMVTRALERTERFTIVGEAEDGTDAVAVITSKKPDLAIVDLSMPGRGGLEVLPDIRAASPDTFVTIFSGIGPDILGETAAEAGAHLYLDKTCPVDEMVEKLLAGLAEFTGERAEA